MCLPQGKSIRKSGIFHFNMNQIFSKFLLKIIFMRENAQGAPMTLKQLKAPHYLT